MTQNPDLVQLVNSMKLSSSAERILTPEIIPVAIPDPDSIAKGFEGLTVDVEGGPAEIRAFSGDVVAQSIQWNCFANKRTRLVYNGAPFRCRELHYSVVNISWQAGNGWPVSVAGTP